MQLHYWNISLLLLLIQSSIGFSQSDSISLFQYRGDLQIENCTLINSKNLEFSPTYYNKGLVYLSSRLDTDDKDKNLGESYLEIFFANIDEQAVPQEPTRFSLKLSSRYHEGPLCFNGDESVLFLTRNNIRDGEKRKDASGVTRLKIFQANRGKEDWESVVEMPFNSDSYSTCHPSFFARENILYFSSDRPGGFGGMDIWSSRFYNGNWTIPENLGENVNGPGNEVFPFIHELGILIYTSNSFDGLGGLDLYAVTKKDGEWKHREHLAEPLNSEGDDLGLILSEDLLSGYFSSARIGGLGKDDIYRIEAAYPIVEVYDAMQKIEVLSLLKKNGGSIPEVEFEIFEKRSDGLYTIDGDKIEMQFTTNEEGALIAYVDAQTRVQNQYMTNESGRYKVELSKNKTYLLFARKDGFDEYTTQFTLTDDYLDGELQILLSAENCVTVSGKITGDSSHSNFNATVIVASDCLDQSLEERSIDGNYSCCVPCGCTYSFKLSASGFQDEMIEREITDCNVSQVIDFQLKSELVIDSKDAFTRMEAPEPAQEIDTTTIAPSDEPKSNTIDVSPGSRASLLLDSSEYEESNGKLSDEARAKLLDFAVNLYQRPEKQVSVVTHTDAMHGEFEASRITKQLAAKVKQYLISLLIAPERILLDPQGSKTPRNECEKGVTCTSEQHQFNRRIEVFLVENQ